MDILGVILLIVLVFLTYHYGLNKDNKYLGGCNIIYKPIID